MKDFYFRNEQDPNYLPDILETSDTIECLITQIRMCLETNNGDVLGAYYFGVGFDELLFKQNIDLNNLCRRVKTHIKEYSLLSHDFVVDCGAKTIYNDSFREDAILDISVNEQSILGYAM